MPRRDWGPGIQQEAEGTEHDLLVSLLCAFLIAEGGPMQLNLKAISRAGIAEAISKAEVYRYLNEPGEAESICRDILAVEPDNQPALRLLGLAGALQMNMSEFITAAFFRSERLRPN